MPHAGVAYTRMVTSHPDACDKCRRRNPTSFHVEPEEAFRTVVLNRWRKLCPSCC